MIRTSVVFNLAPLSIKHAIGSSPGTPISDSQRSQNQTPKLGLSSNQTGSGISRIIWCNFIPESVQNDASSMNTVEDGSRVFVLTRKNRADIFNLDIIQQNYDITRQLDINELHIGHLITDEHKSTILTASFSPDGSAIATSSADGEVNFFKLSFNTDLLLNSDPNLTESLKDSNIDLDSIQVSQDNPQSAMMPKCLQKWHPHENKPVTSLYFLDDHKNSSSDAQFWSFVITGADYNREIKIWCCIKWECLQTLRFTTPSPLSLPLSTPDELDSNSAQIKAAFFKTAIDLTSTYLVMSDINRRCFYVLHLFQDVESSVARCTAISEYILAYPALSFTIIDTYRVKAKKFNKLNVERASMAVDDAVLNDSSNDAVEMSNTITSNRPMMSSSSSSSSLLLAANTTTQSNVNENDFVTMVRLYCIQTKQLQEMQIFLTGDQSINAYTSSSSPSPPPILSNNNIASNHGHNHSINSRFTLSLPTHGFNSNSGLNNMNDSQQRLNTSISFTSDHLSDVNVGSDFEHETTANKIINNKMGKYQF